MDNPAPADQPRHIVALDTYGSEQITRPQDHRRVPAIKCVRAVPAILKVLFGDLAEDVTPPRASYAYIHLAAAYHLKKSYLVLCLTDAELAQVEALTRPQPYGPWVFLWRDRHWHEFPCQSHSEYRLASATSASSYPRFSGTSVPWLTPSRRTTSDGAEEASAGGLIITQSGDWWWIGGNTKPHKDVLSKAGCRWSSRRQQWYYTRPDLPQAVRSLAEGHQPAVPEASTQRADVETAAASPEPNHTLRARRITTVGREFVGSKDYTWMIEGSPTASEAAILERHCGPRQGDKWRCIGETLPDELAALVVVEPEIVQPARSYAAASQPSPSKTQDASALVYRARPGVDDGLDLLPGWLVRELHIPRLGTSDPTDPWARMIYAKLFTPDADWYFYVARFSPDSGDLYGCQLGTQDGDVFGYAVLNGDMYNAEWGVQRLSDLQAVRGKWRLSMERDTRFQPRPLREALAVYRRERGWPDPADSTPASTPDTQTAAEDTPAPDVPQPVPSPEPASPDSLAPALPATTVAETELLGLTAAPSAPIQDLTAFPVDTSTQLPQSYVGRVNVVGDCFCFGLVLDHRPPAYKGIPIYLSVAGPATSVEAVWAKLSQGKQTTVIPDDKNATAIYLEPNQAGLYTRYQKKIEALGIDHLILLHEDLAEPTYSAEGDDVPMTYVLCLSAEHARAKLGEHVHKLVKVAVFDAWFDYLYAEGLQEGLLRVLPGQGIQALAVSLHKTKWTGLITEGLAKRRISLP